MSDSFGKIVLPKTRVGALIDDSRKRSTDGTKSGVVGQSVLEADFAN